MKTFSKILIVPILLLIGVSGIKATERLYIEEFNISPGNSRSVGIELSNSGVYTGFQADIELPEGLNLTLQNGEAEVNLSSRADASHMLVSNRLADGTWRIVCFSSENVPFSGTEGELLTIRLKSDAQFAGGSVTIKNILFTNTNNQDVAFLENTTQIGITEENSLSTEPLTIENEGEYPVTINLKNDTEFSAFQFDIILPEELSVVENTLALTSRLSASHNLTQTIDGNKIRVLAISVSNAPITGSKGGILTFNVKAEKNIVAQGEMKLQNILFSTANANEYILENSTVAVSINVPLTLYTISVSSSDEGMGSATSSETEVEEGATVTLTATPKDGYKFTNWRLGGEVVSTDNPYQATITANSEFVANFEALPTSGKFEAVNSDGVTIWYNITSYNTAEVTYRGSSYSEYSGEYSGEVNIPSTVEYSGNTYSVTAIGEYAFRDCNGLTSVTIPEGVTAIEMCAFWGCDGLTSVTIPEGVTAIGKYAFRDCNGLTSVVIPESVTSIGSEAFYYCTGLTSVTIPESVTSIGTSAFSGCGGLTSVTIPEGVTIIGGDAFRYCDGLTSVTIPESVTSIGRSAFYNCTGLTSVTIPEGVTSIGDYAFSDCDGLTEIEVAENNINYSSEEGVLFNKDKTKLIQYPIGNSRTSYSIPESVTSIGISAFEGCDGLTSVTIPNSVTSIGSSAFFDCDGLTSVTIPEGVTSIGDSAFRSCSGLTEIEVAENNTNYSSEEGVLFNKDKTELIQYPIGNSRTSYSIPEGVTTIGGNAFSGCSGLTSVTISEGVTSIGDYAFNGCYRLRSVTIPEGVTSIGDYAFWGCTGLTEIYSLNPVAPTIYSTTFDYVPKTIPVYIPKGSLSSYQSAEYWSEFTNFVEIKEIYTISVSSSDEGMGSATASETEVEEGATVTLTATPKDGYKFTNWTLGGEVVSTDNPYQATITANSEFVANFEALPTSGKFEAVNSDGVTIWYNITSYNTAEVTYKGSSYSEYSGEYSGEVNIPSTVEYSGNTYSVTEIGDDAFSYCYGLTSVTIPEGVTTIGDWAFWSCDGLTSVTIPESVTAIGDDAFSGCYGLTSVTIPESVTAIGDDAFSGCYGLTEIEVAENNTNYSSEEGVLFNKDKTELIQYPIGNSRTSYSIPEGVTSIGYYAFSYCYGLTSVTIPKSVTSIGSYAFRFCNGLTSVTIPEGVTSIGDNAFSGCSGLTSVTIPESVTSIGEFAFLDCTGLTEIEVAENNTNYSSEEGVLFNKDKTELIQYPIGNSRTSYSIPEGVTSIGDFAFRNCSGLRSVTIPESVTSIGDDAFWGCDGLTSVTIPEGVTSIGYGAFWGCTGLRSVTIPESVTSIGSYAFSGCNGLTEIYSLNPVAPDISSNTFANVSKTIPVYIPKGSLSAYQSAEDWSEFTNFVEIKEIYTISVSSSDEGMGSTTASETEVEEGATVILTATPKDGYKFTNWRLGGEVVSTDNPYQATITANSEFVANFEALPTSGKFEAVNSDGVTIWYNITSYNTAEVTYRGSSYDEYSGEYSGEVNIPSTVEYSGNTYSVTSIGDNAFYFCTGLTSVTIPESVTSIGDEAFYHCEYLTSVTIPESVTSIGRYAFSDCYGLTSVTIPEGVTSIGEYAFFNCDGLTSVTIPESVTSIGYGAFYNCNRLTEIEVAENNTNYSSEEGVLFNKDKTELIQYPIGNSRTSYSIPEGVTTIGHSAFWDCTSLTSVTIPEGVTSIGSHAFYNCEYLTSVTIPEGVTSIGSSAFSGCTGLTSVIIPESVTSIGYYAFSGCTGLTEIYSLNPVAPDIYSNTFANVPKTIPVYIPKGSLSSYQSAEYWSEFTNFVEIKEIYTISVSSSDEGMGSATASETEVEEGATVTLTATPKDGYKFTNWTLGGEVVSTDNPYQATITANSEFVANFEALPTSGKFEAVNSDGVTIWYNITSYNTAEVTYKGSSYSEYSGEYSGEVNIPSTVEYNGNTYSVTAIGSSAFWGCNGLTSVTIPEGVTSIGNEAFYSCDGLTSVVIPESVTSIGSSAFSYCYGLTEIEVAENNTNYSSEEGVLFNKDKTELIQYPIGNSRTSYSIPESVTSIGSYAFSDCTGLTRVTIPESVTAIGDKAFYFCTGLTSVTIPEGVTTIGMHAFYHCDGLTSVTIPESVTSIGYSAFRSCTGLTEIEVAENNTNYSSEEGVLFNKDKTELIQYPEGNSRTSYSIPEGVTSIGSYAFYNCRGLRSVTIPNSVTAIGDDAFNCCYGLTSVTIPEGVTSIESSAFNCCYGLTSVTIPESVTSIEGSAFSDCTGLTEIYSLNPVAPDIYSNTFGNVSKTIPVYIPKGSLSSYQSAEYWSEFTNFVEIKEIYTISVSSSDEGMGSATASETEVEEGATVTLTATPKDGYKFTNWRLGGEVVSTDNPYQATITANSEFVANFEELKDKEVIEDEVTNKDENLGNVEIAPEENKDVILDINTYIFKAENITINVDKEGNSPQIQISIGGEVISKKIEVVRNVKGGIWDMLSLPFDVNISDITVEGVPAEIGVNILLQYYDGAFRAEHSIEGETANAWKAISSGIIPANQGFAIAINSRYDGDVQEVSFSGNDFAMDSEEKELTLKRHESSVNKGMDADWNFLGNPTLSNQAKESGYSLYLYNTESDSYTEYSSSMAATIKPFSAWFVQSAQDFMSMIFGTRPKAMKSAEDTVEGTLSLNINGDDDATIIINPEATEGYQRNEDALYMASPNGNLSQLYIINDGVEMAVSEQPEEASTIAIGYKAVKAGEQTLTLTSVPDGTEVTLTDNHTGTVTQMSLGDSYNFESAAGTYKNRFSLNMTDMTSIGQTETTGSIKVVVTNDEVKLYGTTEGAEITLYTASGMLITKAMAEEGITTIPTTASGVIIIKVGTETIKAVK